MQGFRRHCFNSIPGTVSNPRTQDDVENAPAQFSSIVSALVNFIAPEPSPE
jgi:hypothetical protein